MKLQLLPGKTACWRYASGLYEKSTDATKLLLGEAGGVETTDGFILQNERNLADGVGVAATVNFRNLQLGKAQIPHITILHNLQGREYFAVARKKYAFADSEKREVEMPASPAHVSGH